MSYQPKTPSVARFNPRRAKNRPSRFAMLVQAHMTPPEDTDETGAQKRAQLMLLCGAPIYVTDQLPLGFCAFIEPDGDEDCPFKVKTLVLRPEEIDKAIAQFTRPEGLAN